MDQRRLLALVPTLSQLAKEQLEQTVEQRANLEALRAQVLQALGNQPLSPDEPFLGGLTIAQYDALTEPEKAALWDQLAGIDLMDMEEIEAHIDAVPA